MLARDSGERGRLDIGLLLDLNDVVADAATCQLRWQDREKVVVNLGRIGSADVVELHGSMANRTVLEAVQVGLRGSDLLDEQLASTFEIRATDHLMQFVVGMTQVRHSSWSERPRAARIGRLISPSR